ncbi:MAG TPA: hypothetical protein VF063_03150 [Gaiellaceae bacterium]
MSKGDLLVERGAVKLEEFSRKAAAKGGFAAKLADELAEDATFLRRLKPSLIKARAQGKAPVNRVPQEAPRATSAPPISASRPPKRRRPKRPRRSGGGPNPFLIAGVALAAGIALAKVIDWRGHAHPRDN